MKESDLYLPLKDYLVQQGYVVKGEVHNCDVIAVNKDGVIVVIELKLSINMTVLLQAVDRLKLTDIVYIGVPKGLTVIKKHRKRIIKLMRMLGFGLIVIDPHAQIGSVDVLCDPGTYKPRQMKIRVQGLLREFQHREGDPNQGGSSTQRGIMTAYRQKAVAIAKYLNEYGETKASIISHSLVEPKTRSILYNNVYGWFDRLGKGVYTLSPLGKSEFPKWTARNQP